MADVKKAKGPKLADPIESTICPATQEMITRSHDLGIETVFDRNPEHETL